MIAKTNLTVTLSLSGLILSGSLVMTVALAAAPQNQKKPTKSAATPAKSDADSIALGKKIYAAQGCATCHAIAGKGGNAGPDLTHTGSAPMHTAQWLADQVANPKAHTPTSTMPAFAQSIKGKDLTALASYLSSLKEEAAPPIGGAAKPFHSTVASDPASVAKIEKLGGSIGALAQNDDHLEVNLHLAGANATDASLTALAGLKNVVHLDLGQTGITDAGLAHVKGMKDLTELHLEGTKITDAGLVDLEGLHELVYLNLYGTNVTDAGLEHLSHLTKLRHLYVWQTKVTDAGVNKLKQALPQLDVVQGWDQAPKK